MTRKARNDRATLELLRVIKVHTRNAMTIEQFLKRNKLSKTTYYGLQAKDLGPNEMRIGRAIRISYRAERDWTRRMERGDAADFNKSADD